MPDLEQIKNESDWINCTDPSALLKYIRPNASRRKLRLFAVGCCRRVQHLVIDEAKDAINLAERYADGEVEESVRRITRGNAYMFDWVHPPAFPYEEIAHARGCAKQSVCFVLARKGIEAALNSSYYALFAATQYSRNIGIESDLADQTEQKYQCDILRDIFRNPFRELAFDPLWRTPEVINLAMSIYKNQSYECMPELREALMSAGCGEEAIIQHCQKDVLHVRGCWLIDLILEKK